MGEEEGSEEGRKDSVGVKERGRGGRRRFTSDRLPGHKQVDLLTSRGKGFRGDKRTFWRLTYLRLCRRRETPWPERRATPCPFTSDRQWQQSCEKQQRNSSRTKPSAARGRHRLFFRDRLHASLSSCHLALHSCCNNRHTLCPQPHHYPLLPLLSHCTTFPSRMTGHDYSEEST